MELANAQIGVIGLGYVGLPIAVTFAGRYPVTGFDISPQRVAELQAGRDSSLEVTAEDLAAARRLDFTTDIQDLATCNVLVVTVPTPIDAFNRPDLGPLEAASRSVARIVKPGDVVIFESTVYPGATEEVCAPLIEQGSGLRLNHDFFVGYSPERINPGDRTHRVGDILKVIAGSTPEAADFVDALYASVIPAGTHKVSSIKVAEAAKVIENTQRDVNIALVNELAMIFHKLGIDTEEVLAAAGTKWNFLPFKPGLVGGHCIGVDPYYLTHKAQAIGHHPAMILAGRRLNDAMGAYVAQQLVQLMVKRNLTVNGARALIMGLTFKENCPDIRNTRVVDILSELDSYGMRVDVYDPWADPAAVAAVYPDIQLVTQPEPESYSAIVLAVGHRQFAEMGVDAIRRYGSPDAVIYDVKYLFPAEWTDGRL
jgi:UDP-N-acetyl-D-galactosamine dehydrogenase